MKKLYVLMFALLTSVVAMAQVTTSNVSGKVTDANGEPLVGATVIALHTPSGTEYYAVANSNGEYRLANIRPGGPYTITVEMLGYRTLERQGVTASLAETLTYNVQMVEESQSMETIVVLADGPNSNMRTANAGAVTAVSREAIANTPSLSRSMNDIMRLSPQSMTTGSGFAVGGGNYRQSFVTVDGAAFNNTFGIGQNLPAGGSPISLDALEQISVSVTPYDVRQSGFTGGAISAVTRSGSNEVSATAYSYLKNNDWSGTKVGDYELTSSAGHNYTYGVSVGGPIIKNKLFYFVNAEYSDNLSAGPTAKARQSESEEWGKNNVRRPLAEDMDKMREFLIDTYGYDPGRYNNYSIQTPSWKVMARVDWNINNDHRMNVRFSKTHSKYSNNPSSSVSPLTANSVFPGNDALGIGKGSGAFTNYGLNFESTRYFQEQNYTSIAAELNSRLFDGNANNMLRVSYNKQYEPRSYVGGVFPKVDILKDGAGYMSFGPDIYTAGNMRNVDNFSVTDEMTWTLGKHNFLAGLSYEYTKADNGFMQGGNGYYVYDSMESFMAGGKPSAFAITHSNSKDLSQFISSLTMHNYSAYLQDDINLADNFKLTAGVRLELPVYPSLENNYNPNFATYDFGGNKYSTDQLPAARLSVSPRVGFNWDLTGDRKFIVRGGTGVFVGRLPYVWLVSVVGNSNVGQTSYYYNTPGDALQGQPDFHPTTKDILDDIYGGKYDPKTAKITSPGSPTILDTNLRMPQTWKSSLAFDATLPGDVKFSLEGIFSKDLNPVVISNRGYDESSRTKITLVPGQDVRDSYGKMYSTGAGWDQKYQNVYFIHNVEKSKAYYYAITAQLQKSFNFGLDLSVAYTHSASRAYSDGIGDQVTSAYKTNTYSVGLINDHELGYGTYVAPDRVLATATYKKEYKNMATTVSLIYDGSQHSYAGGYDYSRFSYTFSANVVGDYGANNLIYVPASRDALNDWKFTGTPEEADAQRDAFWNYIEQDKYLSSRKGQYTERGGALMPWHHQFDFQLKQDFYVNVGGKRNTIQLGVDVQNLGNLLNKNWGHYQQVKSSTLLNYDKSKGFTFNKYAGETLTSTFKAYESFMSTYRVQFSVRYLFN